jgi:hypothetical protein
LLNKLSLIDKGQLCGANIGYLEKMKKYPDLEPKFNPLVVESKYWWLAWLYQEILLVELTKLLPLLLIIY